MISYAQNLEDVVLSRLTRIAARGAYVDVGAGHPVLENVTYALYRAGWRGINVEPMAAEASLYAETRPEDATIRAAVGAEPGRLTLFEAPLENRGATTSSPQLVARYETAGQTFHPFEVDVVTLGSLLARSEPGSVHVVKIDVEGMEPEVLAGADLALHRPWVLVIESTVPNSATVIDSWCGDVVAAGYVQTLFDGLNRFFVRADLDEVRTALSVPANVFDRWTPHWRAPLETRIDELQQLVVDLDERLREAGEHYAAMQLERQHDQEQLAEATRHAIDLDEHRRRATDYARSLEVAHAEATRRIAELERELASQHALVGELQTRVARVDELESIVEDLEDRLLRNPPR